MGKNMKSLVCLLFLLAFVGCENNPYPNVDLNDQRTQREAKPRPGISLAMEDSYDLFEGSKTQIDVDAIVEVGRPDVEVIGLPTGAEYDEETFQITWQPNYFAGNDPKDPTKKVQVYNFKVSVGTTDPEETRRIERTISLVVYDVPRNLDINGSDSKTVYENDKLRYEFTIDNPDYVDGPFKLVGEKLPSNTNILSTSDPKKFVLEFEPDYFHVKASDTCSGWRDYGCKEYKSKLVVTNPAGHQGEKEITIKVKDRRLDTKLVAPDFITQGLDLSLQVSAYDLNKEVAPNIRLIDTPQFGDFNTTITKNPDNYASVLDITWNDIPPTYNGQIITLKYEACVKNSQNSMSNCKRGSTDIKINVKERKAPTINRSQWPAGKVEFLGFNERKSFNIYIRDGEDSRLKPTVTIEPKEMQKYVSFNNDRLTVNFSESGIYQFNLRAKSDYNVETSESFIVEVFSKLRSKTLYFTDSTKNEEVKFYREAFPNFDIMNPNFQDLNIRNLSGRDTLVLGTSILMNNDLSDAILNAMDKINDVVIASPLIQEMPEKFMVELEDRYKVSINGRLSQLPNAPKLSKMEFVQRDDFRVPKGKIQLKGSATDVSADPVLFVAGVERKNCQDVLDLADSKREKRYKIGVICDRLDGHRGRLAILGTEWADLKFDEADKDIPARWLSQMLNNSLNP
jgi:hypothetical protein